MSVLANLSNADEIDYYEEALQRYLDLEIDADRFTAIRLQQGTYGQRQEGVHMMRVKLPGGRLTPAKLDTIAGVMSYTEHPYAHITTRQDIQLHYVPLASTPAVMRTVVCVSVSLAWVVMVISGGWWASSLSIAAEDRQQLVQSCFHPPEIADVAPMDGIGVMTEVVVGELLQPFQFGVDGG